MVDALGRALLANVHTCDLAQELEDSGWIRPLHLHC